MPKRNVAWILVILIIGVLTWQLPPTVARRDAVYQTFGSLVDIRAQIHRRYVEEVDDEELVRGAIDGMLRRLDPFSTYIPPDEYGDFQERTNGELHGVGIEIHVMNGELTVTSPIDETPAFYAGIMPGDVITEINGESTEHLSISETARRIKGQPGTKVTLTLRRAATGKTEQVTITRQAINLPTVKGWSRKVDGSWDYMIDPEQRIGYVRLASFVPTTLRQLDEVVEQLQAESMQALILDLRFNPGGLLSSAVDVGDRFLTEGVIVETRGRWQRSEKHVAKAEGTYPNFPMVVLVNRVTASAAEIVAGALGDHHRALVIGERTLGKGSVQNVIELEGHESAIKLTTAYYYLPNGELIHRTPAADKSGKWGVEPLVEIRLTDEETKEILESRRESSVLRTGGSTSSPASSDDVAVDRPSPVIDRQLRQGLIQLRVKLHEQADAA
ncbi:MAG TPA: S41 family peptidase [Phycisphaerae bacterium]|nr:S41 family peptidase [Phycisphaerae bacterium]